ncbi:MAG TPA: hypothetical protein VL404_08260 [Candidatus Eisenbacteria bacterium]|jgi:hypothetical protein|nr:hypothetical protein [Candidatus Eisenbacteria bacterium]
MTNKPFFLLAAALLLAAPARAAAPEITLVADEADGEAVHSSKHPLLLYAAVSARGAQNDAMSGLQTRRAMQAFSRTPEFAKMTKEGREKFFAQNPARTEEKVSTGSKKLGEIIRFTVKDEKRKDVRLRIRPLADSAGVTGGDLVPGASVPLFFGVDAKDLSALPEGVYSITAALQARAGASSEPVTVRIVRGDAPPVNGEPKDKALSLAGKFHVLDRNWTEAGRYADLLIAGDPKSVDGWTLKGDSRRGLGDKKGALLAYGRALQFAQENKDPHREEPLAISRRIEDLQRADSPF